jgi:hypothetical protein
VREHNSDLIPDRASIIAASLTQFITTAFNIVPARHNAAAPHIDPVLHIATSL